VRMLLKVSVPVEAGNAAIKDGSLQKAFQETIERIKPEAVYFTLMDGRRTALLVFDMVDQAKMPPIGEPLFMGFDAELSLTPVMNGADLEKGLAEFAG
jgi:hypothetical protein